MEAPTRHVNLTVMKHQQKQNPHRQLVVAAAKAGHSAQGVQFGSRYDMNFWNEYSQFHALRPNTANMNEVRPRKVIKKAK
jgi:hypothetical protein